MKLVLEAMAVKRRRLSINAALAHEVLVYIDDTVLLTYETD